MTINDQIRDENIRYNIYREAAKISALSSVEIRKFESLTGEDILSSNQQKIREQEKLVILLLEKLLKKKNNWRSRTKTGWWFKSSRTESNQKWI